MEALALTHKGDIYEVGIYKKVYKVEAKNEDGAIWKAKFLLKKSIREAVKEMDALDFCKWADKETLTPQDVSESGEAGAALGYNSWLAYNEK